MDVRVRGAFGASFCLVFVCKALRDVLPGADEGLLSVVLAVGSVAGIAGVVVTAAMIAVSVQRRRRVKAPGPDAPDPA